MGRRHQTPKHEKLPENPRFLAGQAQKRLFPSEFNPDELRVPFESSTVATTNGHIGITFLGHACTMIDYHGFKIVTDPFLSKRASFSQHLGPSRRIPPVLPANEFPPVDLILLSHNHFDHMDLPALESLGDKALKLIPLGDGKHLEKAGLFNYLEMDWGDNFTWDGIEITFLPAKHFSARTGIDKNKSLWGGYLIEIGSKTIYFSGDTAMGNVFSELAELLYPVDVSIISIGSYNPRFLMKDSHLTPEQAVRISLMLGAGKMIPIHWGTIELAAEKLTDPAERLKKLVENGLTGNLDVDILPAGKSVLI
jgi:L-ascorbate metabolism protein UlaG (beta-lactamase superfamily)